MMFKAEVYHWLLIPGDHTTPMKTVIPLNKDVISFKVYAWDEDIVEAVLDVLQS